MFSPGTQEPETAYEPLPANIIIKDIEASPTSLQTGESATITIYLENTGESSGTKTVVLYVDDHLGGTDTISLDGGETDELTFTIDEDEAGTYTARVGDCSTQITYIQPDPEQEPETIDVIEEDTETDQESDTDTDEEQETESPPPTIIIDIITECTRIIDGDTFETTYGQVIRLADIDAPESYETGYQESTDALEDLIYGLTVYLDVDDVYETDYYGTGDRYVCVVYLENGLNVNQQLVVDGYSDIDDFSNEFDPYTWVLVYNLDTTDVGEFEEQIPEEEPEETEPEPSYKYVASKNSDVFHHIWCSYVDQILPSNRVYFYTRQEAIDSGRRPCKRCNP